VITLRHEVTRYRETSQVDGKIADPERVRPPVGSGTTGLAALQLGRRFAGIDLSPDFARLAAGRLTQAVTDLQEGER
jgi:DNA methylase